jgi:tRNA(Leu) C34 or U34 (ribose-2'-O)-methylase TrmL
MHEKSLARWKIVTLTTTCTAFTFAVAYALTGYVVFGQQTEGIDGWLRFHRVYWFSSVK